MRSSCGSRLLKLPKGSIYWRARLESASELIVDGDVSWGEARPFAEGDMKPISNWQSEGRANPEGSRIFILHPRARPPWQRFAPGLGR